jgi:hypothetical protein
MIQKSLKKPALDYLLITYFILRTHGITQIFPDVWVLPLVGISLYAIMQFVNMTRKERYYLFIESKWIVLSVFVLLIHIVYQHGNFKLYSTFAYLVTSIPLYIIGFKYGLYNSDSFIRKIAITYFIFITVYLLPKTVAVLSMGSISDDIFNSLFLGYTDLDFILFWPYAAFVAVIGFTYMKDSKSGMLRTGAVIFFLINVVAFILSSKAAPMVFMILLFMIYNILKKNNTLKYLFHLPATALSTVIIILIIGFGYLGDLGSLKNKFATIILFFQHDTGSTRILLDNMSYGRITAGYYSILQFIQSPIWGNGVYAEANYGNMGLLYRYSSASGNHSFFFDTLAFYGITGIPLLMILIKFIQNGIKYSRLQLNNLKNNVALIWASSVVAIFIANIINSTFLFSSFDNYLFLFAGYYLGKYYISREPTCQV